ncbi:uncharacterized protein [Dermacentor albipictus]|uniref:uncharacterized protein isoform X7 n=1 Tax=Dermacentor albipictus TaxID=60249 RepID=UPI0031FD5E2B
MSEYPLRIAPDEPEIPEPLDEPEIPEPIDEPEIPEPLVDEDPDDLDALGGGGGGSESRAAGGNASSPASPPAGTPPETSGSLPVLRVPTPQGPVTPKPATTPTTTPRMTTTTTLTPFTELVCTVSGYWLFMFPPDGLCHYLFYWDVVVFRKTIQDVDGSHYWEKFKDKTARLKKTSGGISFDSRVVAASIIRSVEKELEYLATINIKHYGVLSMLATREEAHDLLQHTKALLQKLKTIQGNDITKRMILAMGLYDYGSQGEYYSFFTNLLKEAVDTSKADTVIAISSVGWLYNSSRCELTPPSVWDTSALPGLASTLGRRYPDLRRHAALMSKHQSNFDLKVKMGLSFELSTLAYTVFQHWQALNVAMIHSECYSLSTASFAFVPCKNTLRSTRGLVHPDVSIAILDDAPRILLFEDEDTLQKKCRDLLKPSTDLRPNMVMLLFNVHLGGISDLNHCGSSDPLRADPFWRVRVVKKTLNIT